MIKRMVLLVFLAVFALISGQGNASSGGTVVFGIGVQDHSYLEFARDRVPDQTVVFRVGQSSPAKDWFAYQPGSFDDFSRHPNGIPFKVIFSLSSPPRGRFILHLDAILLYTTRPATPDYRVDINGHVATYHLDAHPAPQLWWPSGGGGDEYIGYASLNMPLRASDFVPGVNTFTLECVNGYGIWYDDLVLTNDPHQKLARVVGATLEPTIFYKQEPSGLEELAHLRIRTSTPITRARIKVKVGSFETSAEIHQRGVFGDLGMMIKVPSEDRPLPAAIYLSGVRRPIFRGEVTPRKRWKVYVMPLEQADFGYDEVPARTLEWENRYIDRFLKIMTRFPSYSFTLDASANLESYLSTRGVASRRQLLGYLKDGKAAVNSLYENAFTGLLSPEETLQMLTYAVRTGREHRFAVNSALQTDEPTVIWALPQLLADAGIKYLAIGSDPDRGPFNPQGLLNFHSPFYWEAPNGAKVLTWVAMRHSLLDQLTWGGWHPDYAQSGVYRPSLFGLRHSLPLYLSQFDRKDYPFDAMLLYGLHHDEVPISHYGDADIIARWNKEYAFPKLIPATESDYFRYIKANFAKEIPTYRGDGGAYWEDEAGADAHVAALNRASQTELVEAEKLESVINWLHPSLRFDLPAFFDAWRNLILADCYVWSDMQSLTRPHGYRTEQGQATHRFWAQAAFRQGWNLRITALDQLGELIKTDKPGVVVFNAESWPRSGFFDFELAPGQALEDPSNSVSIPCGLMKAFDRYEQIRCWASDVPALGYKYYTIVRGVVPRGKPITLANPTRVIDSRFYEVQLDTLTGAIAHLIDKSTGRDLVDASSPFQLGEYLYVTGGDPSTSFHVIGHSELNNNRLLSSDPTLPIPILKIHSQTMVGAPEIERFPWGTAITVHARAPNTPAIVSTVILNDEKQLVHFNIQVDKLATLRKEAVYFAFPFQIERPQIEFQDATAWVNPESDLLPGANRQWFTTRGGVRIRGEGESVGWATPDAPLITLEDINRGLWPELLKIRNASVFSYAMNNYWYVDTPAEQGGRFTFSFALTSGRELSQADAARLATQVRSPLCPIRRYHKEWKQILPETGASFLDSSPASVEVLTIRPTLDHHNYLIRVHNVTGRSITCDLRFPFIRINDAYLSSVLGRRIQPVRWSAKDVRFKMSPYDVKTVVVSPSASTGE